MKLKRPILKLIAKRNPEAVYRLAQYLKLRTEGMRPVQVANLIAWRLHPNRQWGG